MASWKQNWVSMKFFLILRYINGDFKISNQPFIKQTVWGVMTEAGIKLNSSIIQDKSNQNLDNYKISENVQKLLEIKNKFNEMLQSLGVDKNSLVMGHKLDISQ